VLRPFPILVAAAILLSGCAGSNPSAQLQSSTPLTDDAGAIDGTVTDETLAPIVGATVGLEGRPETAKTDAKGRFQLQGLATGTYVLRVAAAGFSGASRTVVVTAGETSVANFELVALPTIEAYSTTAIKSGRIFCGADWRLPQGPQGPFAACGALYATPANDLDSFAVTFDLSTDNVSAVRELVFETFWTPTQAFGSGLRVFWEAYQVITPTYEFTEDLRTFRHVQGSSPLWGSADYVDILDNVTGKKPPPTHCAPNGPCRFWARVFPYASTLGSSAPLDVSTYVDQGYTHHVTEFYGLPAPPGFSTLSP
jgi:hypothetical protein